MMTRADKNTLSLESADKLLDEISVFSTGFERDFIELKEKCQYAKSNLQDLENQINKLRTKIEILEKENLNYQRRLEERESQIEELKSRIDIISNIISAPIIDSKRHKKFTEIKNFLFNEFIPEMDKMNISEEEYSLFKKIESEYALWEYNSYFPYISGKPIIAFVGKFSSGKSSLINTFVGKVSNDTPGLLPVDIRPETAVPTFITSNTEPKNEVFYEDQFGKFRKIEYETFIQLNAEKVKSLGITRVMKRIFLAIEKSVLSKWVILDTPGFGDGNHEENEKILEFVLEKADIVFFVVDIGDGCLQKDSIKVIQEINTKGTDLYILLNKIDTKSPMDRKIIKNKINDQIKEHKLKCKEIVEVSNKDKYKLECYAKLEKLVRENVNYSKKLEEDYKIYSFVEEIIDKSILEIQKIKNKYIREINNIRDLVENYLDGKESKIKLKEILEKNQNLYEENIYIYESHENTLKSLLKRWKKFKLE
ncbi:MAG: dynamin family protein [Chitinispirillaceae bacterium]|nr:dynamin family protein [Chitinispirillaceae bacterium]